MYDESPSLERVLRRAEDVSLTQMLGMAIANTNALKGRFPESSGGTERRIKQYIADWIWGVDSVGYLLA